MLIPGKTNARCYRIVTQSTQHRNVFQFFLSESVVRYVVTILRRAATSTTTGIARYGLRTNQVPMCGIRMNRTRAPSVTFIADVANRCHFRKWSGVGDLHHSHLPSRASYRSTFENAPTTVCNGGRG